MKKISDKQKELVLYLLFGILTTAVNFVAFWAFTKMLGEKLYLVNNALAWIIAVAFAYVTNKLFVFESKSWKYNQVIPEMLEFLGARVFSFVIEEGGLWVFVSLLNFEKFSFTILGFELTGQLIAKIDLAVIVVILNYFFSKFIIFKDKSKKG